MPNKYQTDEQLKKLHERYKRILRIIESEYDHQFDRIVKFNTSQGFPPSEAALNNYKRITN
jgi:hypothetical protein